MLVCPTRGVLLQGSLIVDVDDGSEGSSYHPAADHGAVALGTPLPPAQEQNWIISGYTFSPSGDYIWCILYSRFVSLEVNFAFSTNLWKYYQQNLMWDQSWTWQRLKIYKVFLAHEKSIFKQLGFFPVS